MQPIAFHGAPADVVRVTGKDRLDLLHRLSTRDLRPLKDASRAVSTLFTTHQGKLMDWVWVLARPDHLLLQASAGRAQVLADWIGKFTIMEDVTSTPVIGWTALTVWGPSGALDLADDGPADGVFTVGDGVWRHGLEAMGTPWVGLLPNDAAAALTERLLSAGATALSEDAMETRRIAAGVPSPQHEYKEEVNPLELRLVNVAVSWNKGCYIGQEVISRLDSYDKVARLTMGFTTDAVVSLPEGGEGKLTRDGRPLGRLTSCVHHGGVTAGLAVVKREGATPGPAMLEVAGMSHPILLRDCPFWQNSST